MDVGQRTSLVMLMLLIVGVLLAVGQSIGAACGGQLFGQGVTDVDKATIVDSHNAIRRKVANGQETRGSPGPQPPASNMRELTWDNDLANLAQNWANQCIWEHAKNRKTPTFSSVGENLAVSWSTSPGVNQNWKGIIDMWYNEVAQVNKAIVPRYQFSSNTGHYTQVVWANTYKIGCGFVNYRGSRGYTSFYVCNYGPAGNVLTQPMYKIGAATSACPGGTSPKDGLCA